MPRNASLLPRTLLFVLDLPRAGTTCGLGLDVFGIHILSLARYRTAVDSSTLVNGLAKISAARHYDSALSLSLNGRRCF